MSKYRWHLDKDTNRIWCKDYRFKRKLARFGPFHLWETIRIVQKSESVNAEFRYRRGIGMSNKYIENKLSYKLIKPYYTILNIIFKKSIDIKEVRNSKYIEKYPFVAELFIDVIRNRKLEQLGI